jgi:hypothetical protein
MRRDADGASKERTWVMKTGERVLIVEDVRDGHIATGKTGIYEGDFPLTITLGYQVSEEVEIEWRGEYDYQDFINGKITLFNGKPANTIYKEWKPPESCPRPLFAMPMNNPRIHLDDGSVIWGVECWWKPMEYAANKLEDDQKELETEKEFLRTVANAIVESQKV